MGSSNTKIQCLQRPAQSGKTRKMQEMMTEYKAMEEIYRGTGHNPINIIIVSNSKSLVDQTAKRQEQYEASSVASDGSADDHITGSCFAWMSGTKETNIHYEALAFRILVGEVTTVIVCAHKKRLEYLYKLVRCLNQAIAFTRTIDVWIDEADSSVKLWNKPAIDVTLFGKVEKVTLVSATFDSIIQMFGRVRILPAVETYPECYHKLIECVKVADDTAGCAIDYLMGVFPKYEETLIKKGMRLFAPGDITIASHDAITEFLRTKGFAVLVLNGKRKCIVRPNGAVLPIVGYDDEGNALEIGKAVARIYHSNGLAEFPFAVTGQMCLGRGLTFQNERFLFDFGIVPPMNDPSTAYQCAARMAGNIKNVANYKAPTLVMTTPMWAMIERQELVAINLSRLVHENKWDSVGEDEMLEAGGGPLPKPPQKVRTYEYSETFPTKALAKTWCGEHLTCGSSTSNLYNTNGEAGNTHFKFRGALRAVMTNTELRESADLAWGSADTARITPVIHEGTIQYVVIYKTKYLRPAV
jgi:hypothetical protein